MAIRNSIRAIYGMLFVFGRRVQRAMPPKAYTGPIAERPIIRPGDYWICETGNQKIITTAALYANIDFPLWIGKTWSYPVESLPVRTREIAGVPPTSANVDCSVVAFEQVRVRAGTYAAFKCNCGCEFLSGIGVEPGCGQWKIWYAPAVKNVIRVETESTATTAELVEYRISPPPEKTIQPIALAR